MAFNLFGGLAADRGLADRAVHTCWPDAPGTVCDVRFAHSQGRLDRAYLGNLMAFDVAFVLAFVTERRGSSASIPSIRSEPNGRYPSQADFRGI